MNLMQIKCEMSRWRGLRFESIVGTGASGVGTSSSMPVRLDLSLFCVLGSGEGGLRRADVALRDLQASCVISTIQLAIVTVHI